MKPQVMIPFKKTIPNKVLVGTHIEKSLYDALSAECKRAKVTKQDIVEWGIKMYLANYSPKKAASLGIKRASTVKAVKSEALTEQTA